MKRILVLAVFLVSLSQVSFSQDKIYRKGGETLKVKVIEIGVDEIKYKLFDEQDGPIYAIEKDRILKIVYQSGRTEVYQNNIKDPELYAGQPTRGIKIDFLSPLLGHTEISFEKGIKPGRSMEFSLGLIGLGKNHEIYYYGSVSGFQDYRRSGRGGYVAAGYKFSKLPDFINRNIRYTHVMQGFYVKPSVYAGTYSENVVSEKNGQVVVDRRSVVFGALMLDFGKQWVMGDRFLLDIHYGFGYSFDNIKTDNNYYATFGDEYSAHNFGVIRLGRSPGLGIMGGIKVGWLLKVKSDALPGEKK